MNEDFITQLATKLKAIGTLKAVGETWISFDGQIPTGGVPFCGQEVSRELWADLFEWATNQGKVKTEAEWQAHASANGGNCPFYSSGDGASTFRVPCVNAYLKGGNVSESGGYVPEGLPNIIGGFKTASYGGAYGVFDQDSANEGGIGTGGYLIDNFTFNVSRSSAIYGNSSHVTPETYNVLVGVYGVGVVTNVGNTDVSNVLSAITKLDSTVVKSVNGSSPKASNVNVWGRPNSTYSALTATDLFFTAPSEGFLVARQNTTTTEMTFMVNDEWDVPLKYASHVTIPLKKGDIVSWSSGQYLTHLYFVSNEV